MKYIAQSTAVWDTISLPDTQNVVEAPGGAGFYALVGMKIWEDDVGLITGVGEDYLSHFQEWYRNNAITTQGMFPRDLHSPKTAIHYTKSGERTEKALYGRNHYQKMSVTPEEIEPFCKNAAGMYIFKNTDSAYWEKMLFLKEKYKFKLLWEIALNAACLKQLAAVKKLAEQVDIFSINIAEAKSLFAVNTTEDVLRLFREWKQPLIYLRLGSRGVYLIQDGNTVHVPSVPGIHVTDATGGGNSSSGGALVGFCRGGSLEEIGAMGNVSASFCIEQWGVPGRINCSLREKAEQRKRAILALLEGNVRE